MNGAGERESLPQSIGGLVDFALASYARRWPFYLALAVLVFLVGTLFEVAIPGAPLESTRGQWKLTVLEYASIFVDAYVIAAVAIGIGTRLSKNDASWRRVAGATAERWLPVLTINILVVLVVQVTSGFAGFGPALDYPALLLVTAPLVWYFWGALSLALPIAALSSDSPAVAVFTSVMRALAFSLRGTNVVRVCVVAFASVVPYLLETIAFDWMRAHGVPRPLFWANVPIDALTVGPVAAIQSVFALDLARRAGMLEKPPE